MNNNPNADSSGWYFGLGIAAMLAGVGLFVYFLLTGIFHITDNLTQVVVPGEADLTLQANLKYRVFLEQQSVVNGQIFSVTQSLSGLTCHIRDGSAGTELPIGPSKSSLTYNVNGRSGRSVLEFTPQAAGTYHLACAYEEGKEGPKAVLAVGADFGKKLGSTLVNCFASMFGGGILGAAFLIFAYRIRQRAKQQVLPASQPFV